MFLFIRFFSISCFLLFFVVKASALGVFPTGLILSAKDPIANITLINEKDEPVTVQLELVRWQQQAEKDIYTATTAIIATPSIFILPPHESQLVRLGLEKPEFVHREITYRLFAQEVVPRIKSEGNALRMAIRLSIPLIIKALGPVQQKVIWHGSASKGQYTIIAENKGNNVVFVNQLQGLSAEKKALTQPQNTFAYILPGSKKTWTLRSTSRSKLAAVKATINTETSISDTR